MKKLLMILAIFSLNFLDQSAHSDGHVETVWETEKIFELPESVIYDATNDVLFCMFQILPIIHLIKMVPDIYPKLVLMEL